MSSAEASIVGMPRGGPRASWFDRRLQIDALEYTDRYAILDAIKQQVVCELDRLGTRRGFPYKFAGLALGQVAGIAEPRRERGRGRPPSP
jgi:hypothetical protein